jgi:hypothetical protein
MKHERLPKIVEEAVQAMEKDIPSPDPARQAAALNDFLAQARQLRQQQAVSPGAVMRLRGWRHHLWPEKESIVMTALAKALVVLVVASGLVTGTALAADSSQPGDALYPVDLAMEQAQLRITTRTQNRAQLQVKLADERAEELIGLAEDGETPDEESVNRLQNQLHLALSTATQLQQQQRTQLLTQLQDKAGQQADEFEANGLKLEAQIMVRTREMAQLGIEDPPGLEAHLRNGKGWTAEEPEEPTDPTDPTDPVEDPVTDPVEDVVDETEDPAQAQEQFQEQTQEQTQTQDQLRDGTCEAGDLDCVPGGDGAGGKGGNGDGNNGGNGDGNNGGNGGDNGGDGGNGGNGGNGGDGGGGGKGK